MSRKSVLPVFKELNNILFYPVQYEGEESERNVFYTGAAPNQNSVQLADFMLRRFGIVVDPHGNSRVTETGECALDRRGVPPGRGPAEGSTDQRLRALVRFSTQ